MVERREFQGRRESARVIQKHYRAYQLCRRERARFLRLRKSALLIQVRRLRILIVVNIEQLAVCGTKRRMFYYRPNSVPTNQENVTSGIEQL